MTRFILTLLIIGISASSTAETRNFPMFSIDVPGDWTYDVEAGPTALDSGGGLISIYRPDGIGVLKMMSYVAPSIIGRDRLRLLTNVDSSTALVWREWGDFSGYQHNYVERESFFKQWWLLNEKTMLLITYESDAGELQIEIETVEEMVTSIKINPV
jgi:hypothetical protein